MKKTSGEESSALAAEVSRLLEDADEVIAAATCGRLARLYERHGDLANACRWALAVVDGDDDFVAWNGATAVFNRCVDASSPAQRSVRLAVLGSATTTQFSSLLRLACARLGVAVELYECDFGQYRQEVLDVGSGLYEFRPDVVLLAVHEGALALPVSMAKFKSPLVATKSPHPSELFSVFRRPKLSSLRARFFHAEGLAFSGDHDGVME